MENIHIFGQDIIDPNAIAQLQNCVSEESDIGVLTPDAHYGYQQPVGGAVAYTDRISVSGVGFDIGCGNLAVKTNINASDVDVKRVMDEIFDQIGFGVGRPNPKPIQHPIFDKIAKANFKPQRQLLDMAKTQLGTVGSGNHYVDLFKDESGILWIGVHFGSRGFGWKAANGFIALSQGLDFFDRAKNEPMDSKPLTLKIDSEMGIDYIEAMTLAGEFAYAGRETVVNKVVQLLGAEIVDSIHNHHNFAWREEHNGIMYWVARKGCTPAFPGQRGFVGSNMADKSVILEGVDSDEAKSALYSTVHGAGRTMSRSAAKKTMNFADTHKTMSELGIELRGGGVDESPACYKKLTEVLSYQSNSVKILHELTPIGVAMAGANVSDPYKD